MYFWKKPPSFSIDEKPRPAPVSFLFIMPPFILMSSSFNENYECRDRAESECCFLPFHCPFR